MESFPARPALISRIDSAVVNYLRRLQLIDFAAVNRLITLPRSREWIILLRGFITKLRSLTNSSRSPSLSSSLSLTTVSPLKFRSSTRFVIFDRGKFLLHCVKLDLCIRNYLKQYIRLRHYYSVAQRNIFIPIVIFVILHNTLIIFYTHIWIRI